MCLKGFKQLVAEIVTVITQQLLIFEDQGNSEAGDWHIKQKNKQRNHI